MIIILAIVVLVLVVREIQNRKAIASVSARADRFERIAKFSVNLLDSSE